MAQLITKLRLPILFLSGRADEIVPAHMMTQVAHCAATVAYMYPTACIYRSRRACGGQQSMLCPQRAVQLHKAAVRSIGKEMVSFPKGKHNSTCLSRGYYDSMKRFVDRVLEEE